MPIKVDWRGRLESLPGTYVDTKSGFPTPNAVDSAGDIMYIDTGSPLASECLRGTETSGARMYLSNFLEVPGATGSASGSGSSFITTAIFDTPSSVNANYIPQDHMKWTGGRGIMGQFANNDSCVYKFSEYRAFHNFVRGGMVSDIAKQFFYPLANGSGTDNLYYARACETLAPFIRYRTNLAGGYFQIFCKEEGTAKCARFETSSIVSQDEWLKIGYAAKLYADPAAPGWYRFEIWEGSYKGSDNNFIASTTSYITGFNTINERVGNTYAGSNALNYLQIVTPNLIFKSKPFQTADELKIACEESSDFNQRFFFPNPILHKHPVTGVPYYGISGNQAIEAAYLTTAPLSIVPYMPFMAGVLNSGLVATDYAYPVESYTAAAMDRLLEVIIDLQNTFFFCDRWGDTNAVTPANSHFSGGSLHPNNLKIINHINTQSAYKKFMFVGAGSKDTDFTSPYGSIYTAEEYNSENVVVVHSGITLKPQPTVFSTHPDYLEKESVYTAAIVAGRLAGLAPQTPGTHKNVNISSVTHSLIKTQGELAGDKGVLYIRHRHNMGWIINHSINSLQKNSVVLNEDGTTPEISVARIAGQLHKELINSCNKRFVGTNIGQSTPATVKAFVENYLKGRVATDQQDGLIISFQDVTVHFQDDWYLIEYGFVPNYPVNKIFIRSFILPYNPITI